MLENGPFCKVDAGARLLLDEKMAVSRPRACLDASTAITKKEVVSVRAMRELSHRWSFFERHYKKMLEMARFCKVDAGARLFFHEQVALSRPRARLGASNAITRKKWFLYARCVKFQNRLIIFLSGTI